jgi:hypothetical protein
MAADVTQDASANPASSAGQTVLDQSAEDQQNQNKNAAISALMNPGKSMPGNNIPTMP